MKSLRSVKVFFGFSYFLYKLIKPFQLFLKKPLISVLLVICFFPSYVQNVLVGGIE